MVRPPAAYRTTLFGSLLTFLQSCIDGLVISVGGNESDQHSPINEAGWCTLNLQSFRFAGPLVDARHRSFGIQATCQAGAVHSYLVSISQEVVADIGGIGGALALENKRAVRCESLGLELVDALVGNGGGQRPVVDLNQGEFLEDKSNFVPVFGQEVIFKKQMELTAHRALQVCVFHDGHRSVRRTL